MTSVETKEFDACWIVIFIINWLTCLCVCGRISLGLMNEGEKFVRKATLRFFSLSLKFPSWASIVGAELTTKPKNFWQLNFKPDVARFFFESMMRIFRVSPQKQQKERKQKSPRGKIRRSKTCCITSVCREIFLTHDFAYLGLQTPPGSKERAVFPSVDFFANSLVW